MAENLDQAPDRSFARRQGDGRNPLDWGIRVDAGVVLAILAGGLYVLWSLYGPQDAEIRGAVSDVAQAIAGFAGMFAGLGHARRYAKASSPARWSAACLTLAAGSWGVGQAVWCYMKFVLHQNPFPSNADAGYLLSSLAMIAGILLLPSRPMPTVSRLRALLDSLLITIGALAFGWFFVLGPTILNSAGSMETKILGSAYPSLDLVVIFGALVIVSRPSMPKVVFVRNLLCGAAVALVVSDAAFTLSNLEGTYQSGGPLDAGWMVANLMMGRAAAALWKLEAEDVRHQPEALASTMSLRRALLPYATVPAVAALILHVRVAKVDLSLADGVYAASAALVLLTLIRQVFTIVENARLYGELQSAYREMEELASMDGMTRLPNHRTFQERLRTALDTGEPTSVLLLDVDRFKQYNDDFGHPAGDEALKLVATLIRRSVRDSDLPARYGGEEFAVVLPETDTGGAILIAERIRIAVESTSFPFREVTVSVGVTSGRAESPMTLIGRADRALYGAKNKGRNRVEVEFDAGFLKVVSGDHDRAA